VLGGRRQAVPAVQPLALVTVSSVGCHWGTARVANTSRHAVSGIDECPVRLDHKTQANGAFVDPTHCMPTGVCDSGSAPVATN